MKTVKLFSTTVLMLVFTGFVFGQKTKTETLKVSGECGMCKKKIEKAAKEAGATYAVWNTSTKVLTIKYNSLSTNSAKIQQNIADAGYDTPKFQAAEEAYNKLDECCQYDRESLNQNMNCCSEKCEMKDGKCVDEEACKEKGCCKDSEKCKVMGCCGNEKGMASDKMINCNSKEKGMGDSKMSCCSKEKGTGKTTMSCCSKEKTTTSSSEKQHH